MPTSGQPADPPCPMRSSLVVFLFSSLGLAFSWADPVASPRDLEARKLENPLGLSLPEYGLFWKAPGQAGYRVLVSSAEDRTAPETSRRSRTICSARRHGCIDAGKAGCAPAGNRGCAEGSETLLQLLRSWWKRRPQLQNLRNKEK